MEHATPTAPHPVVLWSVVLMGISALSVASLLIRLADAPPLAIAAYRVALAAMLISPVFALSRSRERSDWSLRALLTALFSGLFLAFHFIFWITSLTMTTIASSVTLVSTTPFFVSLVSSIWLRERPNKAVIIGILFSIAGSALVAGSDFTFSQNALAGDLLALLGSIMASGYLIAGKLARRSLDVAAYTFVTYGTAAVLLLIGCWITETRLNGFSDQTYIVLILLALIPQLVGHTTFNWTLIFFSPIMVSLLILGEPIGATILAYLILAEKVTELKGFGLLTLAAGIALSSYALQKRLENR